MESVVTEILIEALDFTPGPLRDDFIDRQCEGDSDLSDHYKSVLLELEETAGSSLLRGFSAQNLILPAGTRIGPFEIIEKIGEGGFGLVYRATQEFPIRRVAALKLLRPGIDTLDVLRRFEQERQVLADLEHPGIARFYDAGSTEKEKPWFAMEYIDGVPIVQFCEEENLGLEDRITVFQQACEAVQYAHLRGVIHRDLKPSNLLVSRSKSGKPEVKIIDFGVSRALSAHGSEGRTLMTLVGHIVGTPAYMSPEQACGSAAGIDLRSDVYSMGAILYELLAGAPVLSRDDISKLGVTGIQEFISGHIPERPSRRRLHGTDSGKSGPIHAYQLNGDLDWIVMKALEKEKGRRYHSIAGLRDDLQAFLERMPVSARPPDWRYLATRFIQRHRTVVMAGAGVFASMIAAIVFSTHQYLREREAREIADREARKSEEVVRFLTETLEAAGPEVAKGRDSTLLRDILRQTTDRIDSGLAGQPHVEAELRRIVGYTLQTINERDEGNEQIRRAVEIQRSLYSGPHEALALSLLTLADSIIYLGNYKEGAEAAKEAEAMWLELAGPEDLRTLQCRTWYLYSQAKANPESPDLEPISRDLLMRWREDTGSEKLSVIPNAVATYFVCLGRLSDAITVYQEEIASLKRRGESVSTELATALDNCGYFMVSAGRDDEAEPLLREALELGDKVYEGKSPHADHVWGALAKIEARRGNLDKQLDYARSSGRASASAYAPAHPFWRAGHAVWGSTLIEQAEHFLDRAWETRSDESVANENRRRAKALLTELKETRDLDWYRISQNAWIDTLEELGSGWAVGELIPLLNAARTEAKGIKSRLKEIEKWRTRVEA